jgi:hypothetical protein
MPSRRQYLTTLSAAVAATAGCVGDDAGEAAPGESGLAAVKATTEDAESGSTLDYDIVTSTGDDSVSVDID